MCTAVMLRHLPVIITPLPVSSRLSLPDQILPDQQSQRPGSQPQDKGQRLPWLDGLWTTQRRGVRVLLLKGWLTFSSDNLEENRLKEDDRAAAEPTSPLPPPTEPSVPLDPCEG